jgi:1-deoxy-D-xylulose-5-phosphate synthase
VTFAAGLACEGMIPVCAIYSTFLQRAYDQVVHDVALQSLPVRFVMDRGGLVGDDGPTHHGVFDVGYLRLLPNFVVMAPKDENEMRHMLFTQLEHGAGPTAMRFPRGGGIGVELDRELRALPIGQGEVLREGDDLLLVAYGSMVHPALDAAEVLAAKGIAAGVINARFVKPLDEELILEYATQSGRVVTLEESQRAGGFGSAVSEMLQDRGAHDVRLTAMAIADVFVEHGKPDILRNQVGLTVDSIVRRSLLALDVPVAVEEVARRPA